MCVAEAGKFGSEPSSIQLEISVEVAEAGKFGSEPSKMVLKYSIRKKCVCV
jgi:hypothetical protein